MNRMAVLILLRMGDQQLHHQMKTLALIVQQPSQLQHAGHQLYTTLGETQINMHLVLR